MTERVLGEKGSTRRRRFLLLPVLVTTVVALFWIAGAQALHEDGVFELGPGNTCTPEAGVTNILGCSGNTPSANGGPDWADIFDDSADHFVGTSGADVIPDWKDVFGGHAAAFIPDPSSAGGASDPSTFSGFGTSNKNSDPISTEDCESRTPPLTGSACSPWGWDSGNVPAKDDLTNVYAYEVIRSSDNHLLLYAGVERETPDGDSHVDIEFFQSEVGTTGNAFTGIRTVDDVIVSMDFLRGGGLGSITIRAWDGNEYDVVGTLGGEGCNGAHTICGFNNGADIDGGVWPNFDNHGDPITTLEQNAFTEMGVDLSALLGTGANLCLSSFMAKTRSSQSFTAELKDFALGTFDVCQPSTDLNVTPSTTQNVHKGDNVTLNFDEINDGNEPILNPSLSGNNGCTPTGVDVDPPAGNDGDINPANGELDPGETWKFRCTISNIQADATITVTATGVGKFSGKTITWCADPSNPPPNTVCDQDERVQVTINVINPATFLLKTAAVSATYTYKEKNVGDDPLTNVTVTDDKCNVPTTPTSKSGGNQDNILEPGETWTFTCTVALTTDGSDLSAANGTNTATGHGTDSLGAAVPITNETDSVTVTVTHAAPNSFP